MNRGIESSDRGAMTAVAMVTIARPGEYRIALPTEDAARELERSNPDGKLYRVGDRWVWIEPERLFGEG